MAWVRTATSLISFGFTIYKFFQGMREADRLERRAASFGPRGFALVMIGLGVARSSSRTIQHRAEMARPAGGIPHTDPSHVRLPMMVASVVGDPWGLCAYPRGPAPMTAAINRLIA